MGIAGGGGGGTIEGGGIVLNFVVAGELFRPRREAER